MTERPGIVFFLCFIMIRNDRIILTRRARGRKRRVCEGSRQQDGGGDKRFAPAPRPSPGHREHPGFRIGDPG